MANVLYVSSMNTDGTGASMPALKIAAVFEVSLEEVFQFQPTSKQSCPQPRRDYQYFSAWIWPGLFLLCSLKPSIFRRPIMPSIMPGLPHSR
jgi:hypothetical protein